jgi:cytochrome c oxidase subunit 4
MPQHLIARQRYFLVFVILLGLTLLTIGAAFLDLGPLNIVIALTIAIIKALLVIFFFMHLRESSSLTWMLVGAGVFWLLLLITLTLGDYQTRGWYPVHGW